MFRIAHGSKLPVSKPPLVIRFAGVHAGVAVGVGVGVFVGVFVGVTVGVFVGVAVGVGVTERRKVQNPSCKP